MNNPTGFRGLWLLVLVFSAIVLQWNLPNMGGNHTPRTLFSWATLVIATQWCWFVAWRKNSIYWNRQLAFLLLPPVAVVAWALLGPTGPFENYALKASMSLLLGALWVAGLVQLGLSRRQWWQLSSLIFLASIALCVNTLSGPDYFNLGLPSNILLSMPNGGFQQPNNFSSFIVTALIFQVWSYTRLSVEERSKSPYLPAIYLAYLFFGTFVISLTIWLIGSRTGYLGLITATALLSVCLSLRDPSQKYSILGVVVAMLCALAVSIIAEHFHIHDGHGLLNRLADLGGGTATVVRKDMWITTLYAWLGSPVLGHGLGTFTDIFTPAFNELLAKGYELQYTVNLTHPHNEILLWLCETGVLGTILILGPWGQMILSKQQDVKLLEHLGWVSVLIPIGLHSMTEYPLHGSGAHWFVLGLILAARFEGIEFKTLVISRITWLVSLATMMATGFLLALFLIHSGLLSFKMNLHFGMAGRDPQKFLVRLTESEEMHHPLLGQMARDNILASLAPYVLEQDDESAIRSTCLDLKDLSRRFKDSHEDTTPERCRAYDY